VALRLPDGPKTPIIMSGPGTGHRRFRAFLLDARRTGAQGKRTGCFFGTSASDAMFYADELNAIEDIGPLDAGCRWRGRATAPRNSTCRTACAKSGRELWTWIAEGALSTSAANRQADGAKDGRTHARRYRRPVGRAPPTRPCELRRGGTQEEGADSSAGRVY